MPEVQPCDDGGSCMILKAIHGEGKAMPILVLAQICHLFRQIHDSPQCAADDSCLSPHKHWASKWQYFQLVTSSRFGMACFVVRTRRGVDTVGTAHAIR